MDWSNKTNFTFKMNFEDNNMNAISYIRIYYQRVMCPIGIIGNFISLLIFIRMNKKRKTNTNILYSILCVLNILLTIESNFLRRINSFAAYNFYFELPICQLENFIRLALFDSISWMQVLISFDRFILIVFPAKAQLISKKVLFCLSTFFN
jgi:hypothetical protein